MGDHGGVHGQTAAFPHQGFIIRLVIFAREQDIATIHGLNSRGDCPVLLMKTGKTDVIQAVQRVEQRHGGSGGQIDMIQRTVQHGDPGIKSVRRFQSFLHDQITTLLHDADKGIATLIIIH